MVYTYCVFQYFEFFTLKHDFDIKKMIAFALIKSKQNKPLEVQFLIWLKILKILENKHLIDVWSWIFINIEWHRNFLTIKCFKLWDISIIKCPNLFIMFCIWYEFSSSSLQKFVKIWNLHKKNLKIYWHILNTWFHFLTLKGP